VTAPTTATRIDPVDYEIFAHRLWAIGEEGRIALQRVTASPIVAQGGECMCSFYDADGTMILACSGHLRFASATSDAIRRMIDWFADDPGIHEGDEFIINDPYVAGSHTYDVMQIAPLFHAGRRVGWVASSSHTSDTGGVLRGAATEIFHEGIRLLGLKIVEAGTFRQDVFKTIVEQCRDPHYVGMDIKSRTAANIVCARGYTALVEQFGIDFVMAAGAKLIVDSEAMARRKLASIPDGVWRSRIYGSARNHDTGASDPYQVICTATKRGDELHLDFAGSSDQLTSDQNSTLPSTTAHVAIALTNQLFWDVPWSDGRLVPIRIDVPEGSALNCRFPAACGRSPRIGQYVVEAVRECLTKMLFAAGHRDDINATWGGFWYLGGPGFFYGGHNRRGLPNPQGLYDIHGGGLGAAPVRDGVPTGGQMNIPSGGISDIERVELQYPFLYLSRNHAVDGGGAGRWNGGTGSARLLMVHGSTDLSVDYAPYAGLPHGAFGLFGGYPVGVGGLRAILQPSDGFIDSLARGSYPSDAMQATIDGDAQVSLPPPGRGRVPIPEGYLLSDFTQGGGGYGDPLDREAETVVADILRHVISRRSAALLYGVVLDERGGLDSAATVARRSAIRDERRTGVRPAQGDRVEPKPAETPSEMPANTNPGGPGLHFHESLDIGGIGTAAVVRCRRCGHDLGPASDNYKRHALRRDRELGELAGRAMPDGSPYLAVLREYACPGCATLLQVDVWCPSLGGEEDLWDIRIDP
jgi:N-methylhydantoinase B